MECGNYSIKRFFLCDRCDDKEDETEFQNVDAGEEIEAEDDEEESEGMFYMCDKPAIIFFHTDYHHKRLN